MNTQPLMVLSTISAEGKSQSAVVGFGQTEKLELIFGTSKLSRKAKNIITNDTVSAVIGWDRATIQLEGKSRILSDKEEEKYRELYFQKNTTARKYKDEPHERYFLITPTWLRYTDTTTNPWDITELQF